MDEFDADKAVDAAAGATDEFDPHKAMDVAVDTMADAVLTAADASTRLDKADAATRAAVAALDHTLMMPLGPDYNGGHYDAMNHAIVTAIYAVARGALGTIDDAAARAAAARNALAAADNALNGPAARYPPYAIQDLLRALDVAGAAASSRTDREIIGAARDALVSARNTIEPVLKEDALVMVADTSASTEPRPQGRGSDGGGSQDNECDHASTGPRPQGRGSGSQDNECDHASTGPRPQGRGSELALHGGTCTD